MDHYVKLASHETKPAAWDWMSPSAEKLLSKYDDLDETIKEVGKRRHLTDEQRRLVTVCRDYLDRADAYLKRPSLTSTFPFFGRKHPHLVWELLHRVDETLILLATDEELVNAAADVKTSFDLNIKQEKIRSDWIGPNGRLVEILDRVSKHEKLDASSRCNVSTALKLVNEQMDQTFWQLSANTLTSVWSAAFLALLMWLAWQLQSAESFSALGTDFANDVKVLVVLGLVGAYVSNLLTKEDFLYVRGAPYWRYWLHNLIAKPVVSAFAAVFVFLLERSKLIFSIGGMSADQTSTSQLITLSVSQDNVGYTYAVLAIVSGFAADKMLRNMFDSVLKRLEQKAEKTKDTEKN